MYVVVHKMVQRMAAQYGYIFVSDRLGDDDQKLHCGIVSSLPSCASSIETAERAAPTIAFAPSCTMRRYETMAGEALSAM
jgi:hypothetical protein